MPKKKLVIATNNSDKFKEITAILNGLGADFMTLQGMSLPEETGQTLKENAILKAKSVFERLNEITLADDTGLEVEAIGNAPGVYSARFAGARGATARGATARGATSPNAVYKENRKKLLTLLEGKPMEQRKAKFKCVVAVVHHDLHHGVAKKEGIKTFEGEVSGYITDKEIGTQGFGYDSIFFIPEFKKTFAQLRPGKKNKISHRAIALLKAKKYLEKLFKNGE